MDGSEITLPAAARRLGQSWPRTWRQVLTGELEGRQDTNGKWLVREASVEQLLRERESPVAVA
jgi:hypothetical protein